MIYKKMKSITEKSGESQKVIAELLGISQPRLNNYLNGKREPDTAFIIAFCKYFKITPNDLYGFESSLSKEAKSNYRDIIETVEVVLQEAKKTLSPEDKAILISSLFDEPLEDGEEMNYKKIVGFVQFFLNTKAS